MSATSDGLQGEGVAEPCPDQRPPGPGPDLPLQRAGSGPRPSSIGGTTPLRAGALALAALDALPQASILVFDRDLRYLVVRGSALAEHGFHSADLEGVLASEALDPDRWVLYEPLYRAALQGETRSLETASPDGRRWYLLQVGPLRDGEDLVVGGICLATDITARKRAEAQFDALLDAAPDAIVVVDSAGRVLRANAQVESLFGYERAELVGSPVELLLPERLRELHAHRREGYSRSPRLRPMGVGLQLAGRRKDGSEFPVEISLGPLATDGGLVVSAAIRDITERQRVERAAAHLAAVVASSRDAIIGMDRNGLVTSWNHGAQALYGWSEAEMLGRSMSVLVPPGHDDELPEILRRGLLGERIGEYETVRVRKDGTLVQVELSVSPIYGADGTILGLSTIARDVTERRRQQEELRYLAEHDPLTGVLNRRRFERDLAEQLARARRYGEQAALLVLDIDAFKELNDRYGHPAGDRALTTVAAAISHRLRDTDALARIGGDEFAVLLPHADLARAHALAADLAQMIRQLQLEIGDTSTVALSASIGAALLTKDSASEQAVFDAADRAMYDEKRRRSTGPGGGGPEPTA